MTGRWDARHAPSARDTIFALSTPVGKSAVAVIRLSGPEAYAALQALTGRPLALRVATFATFRCPATGDTLDEGLALYFRAPNSFTGEDCAEIQCHGSIAAVRAISSALAALPGLREARPGEFTQRAFANRKIDLARTEVLADLIEAQTQRQRRLALRATPDGPARLAEAWRDDILDMLAAIDARLDFADEGDVGALQNVDLAARLGRMAGHVADTVRRAEAAGRVRDGFVVAICGPPNAGKSTLLNALIGREQAIVSPHAGTTRDAIEVSLDLGGSLVTLIDTAGLRETVDAVERIGIARARAAAVRADMVLWLTASDACAEPPPDLCVDLRIATKSDLSAVSAPECLRVSAATGEGIDGLIALLAKRAGNDGDDFGDATALRARHVEYARCLARELTEATAHVTADRLELAAAHLRGALAHLEALGSKTADEDVLDRIFGRFCIGK